MPTERPAPRRMPTRRRVPAPGRVVAVLALTALAVGGCSEPGTIPAPPAPNRPSPPEPAIVVNALRPITLMPGDIQDPYGARVAAVVHRGLMRVDVKGKAVPEVAELVESDADQVFRIRLRKDAMFTTGEVITPATFVRSWNWVAAPANRQSRAELLAPIAGWAAVRAGRQVAGRAPTLTGLRVLDATTLQITLARPTRDFISRLADPAFAPLPVQAMADPAAFAVNPIGNGPYRLEGDWQRRAYLRLVKNPLYRGDNPALNDGLVLRYLPERGATYEALRTGALDVLDAIPVHALSQYRSELKLKAANQPVGVTQSLAFPVNQPPWNTAAGLLRRRAISMAIDRRDITDRLFVQTRTPATDLAAPVVEGHSEQLCGSWCAHDVPAARAAWRAAGPFTGPLEIAYSKDSDDAGWVAEVCAALSEHLSVACQTRSYPDQAAYLTAISSGTMSTPFVTTTPMATPNLAGFLTPRFAAGSVFNDTGYAGQRVQALFAAGSRPDSDGGRGLQPYLDAERQLLQDLPVIPLWTRNATGGVADNVEGFKFDVFGQPVYTDLTRQ